MEIKQTLDYKYWSLKYNKKDLKKRKLFKQAFDSISGFEDIVMVESKNKWKNHVS